MLPMPKLSKRYYGDRIAFFGPMASGKTWMANYFWQNYQWSTRISFADPLKALAYKLYGIEGKSGTNRTILQELGQDIRKHDPDVWIKLALEKIIELENTYKEPPLVLLDDLRYVNEAKALKRNGFMLVQVATSEEIRQRRIDTLYPKTPAQSYYHGSEVEWRDIRPDVVVKSESEADGEMAEYHISQAKIFGKVK